MAQSVKSVIWIIVIGTALWSIAGITALILGAEMKIFWTCVMGATLGLTGIRYTIRRARKSGL